MSGGFFNYKQYELSTMISEIESVLQRQGTVDDGGYQYPSYPEDIVDRMKETICQMQKCENMLQRVDWFLSGDDGDDSFRRRWKEEVTDKFLESKPFDYNSAYWID